MLCCQQQTHVAMMMFKVKNLYYIDVHNSKHTDNEGDVPIIHRSSMGGGAC